MRSTGNDIVALKSIDKQRTNDIKFYSKIINRPEQSLYNQQPVAAMPLENYVWLLWSVKESVYKYLKRGIPDLVFSPTKIGIENLDVPLAPQFTNLQWESSSNNEGFYQGKVAFDSHFLYFKSIIHSELICTVVDEDEQFTNVYWGIETINDASYDHQSTSVRQFILNKLKTIFPVANLQITKSETGYPIILNDQQELDIPLSIAHHQLYTAYSFKL